MQLIDVINTILLGIIEGITEWLPISSTGHLILAEELIHLHVSEAFWELFMVVIQLGAIMAVVVLYWKKLFPFSFQKGTLFVKTDIMQMWFKVVVAVFPAVVVGLPFNDLLEKWFNKPIPVACMLILYGVLFILIENAYKGKSFQINDISEITYKTALFIGIFQLLALMPGTSRSGATIIGAMLIGTSRAVAAEFTFYLAIPVMFGASLLKIVKFGFDFTGAEIGILLLGMVTAFVVSILAIKFLMSYIKKHDFKVFGYYRIVLGIVVLGYFFLK